MEKESFEYKRTKGDEEAEQKTEETAKQGKWNQFNQPGVEKKRISEEEREKVEKLNKKYFDREFKTNAEENAYENEVDELDEAS